MRIGIDASNIRAAGGLTHLIEMLKAARPHTQGVERVLVWGGERTLVHLPQRPWLEFTHEPILDRPLPWRVRWQYARLPQLAQERCDVLFTPGATLLGGNSCPVVTISQNMLPFESSESRRYGISWMRLKMMLLQQTQTRSFSRADGVIFLTEYARRRITAQLPAQQLQNSVVIPHGVADRFRLAPRPQQPITSYSPTRPFRLLYVSSVALYKHQWQVAEAVGRLKAAGMPIAIDFVGSAYPPALRQLRQAMRGWDPSGSFIFYRCHVGFTEVHEWYHQADAFVFASSCENLPNILLEAMAAGLPIASSNRGPMPEVLGDAGFYFDPEDPLQTAEVLRDLVAQPEKRHELAWKAFKKANAYSWERCAAETFGFLATIAQKSVQ